MTSRRNDGRIGEDKLLQLLSEFFCPLNADMELFLKQHLGTGGVTDALTIGAQQGKTVIDTEVFLAAANNQSLT